MSETVFKVLMTIIVCICGVLLFETGRFIYNDYYGEKIELLKSQWKCTDTHIYQTTVMVPIGKVIVPQIRTITECIEYKRK